MSIEIVNKFLPGRLLLSESPNVAVLVNYVILLHICRFENADFFICYKYDPTEGRPFTELTAQGIANSAVYTFLAGGQLATIGFDPDELSLLPGTWRC